MSGFDNDVVNCKNWDFRQTSPVQGQATSGGDLPIGTGGSPEIEVGQIVSSDASIIVTYSNPNIDISAGSSIPTTIVTDTGSATPVANILNLSGGAGVDTSGSGNTVTLVVDLTELPTVATTYAGDTGSATPAANTLTLAGGTGIDTSAAGSTVTFNFDETEVPAIATSYETQSGTAVPVNNVLQVDGVEETLTRGSGDTVSVFSPRLAKYVVDPTTDVGTHTTIQGAIDAASSGDQIYIRYGTYTEDLTLKAGVLLASLPERGSTKPEIVGKCSLSSGECTLKGLKLTTNSDYAVSATGSGLINIHNCNLNGTNNDVVESTSSNVIRIENSSIDLSADVKAFASSGTGGIFIRYCTGSNSASVTASTMSGTGTTLRVEHSDIPINFSISSSSGSIFRSSRIDCATRNITALTTAGTGNHSIINCDITCGTASCVSVGAGTTVTIAETNLDSTNTNVVTGAGTVKPSNLSFSGSSSLINTTTQTELNEIHGPISFDGGTNFLDYYEEGSWTPQINATTSSPTITYSLNSGKYTRIGNVVYVKFEIQINTISGGSGVTLITGLPFTSSNDSITTRNVIQTQGVDWNTGYTSPVASIGSNQNQITMLLQGDNVGATTLSIGNLANGDDFYGQIYYYV